MFSLVKQHFFERKLIIHGRVLLAFKASRSTATHKNDEYQYIQKSRTPTMHFQLSLPRLPIPKLEDTCKRYLNAQMPLLSKEDLEKTKLYTMKFLNNEGMNLHKQLIEQDAKNCHTSYISEPWFDMYLRDRKPLPINYNPFIVFAPETNSAYNEQLVKAANLLISSLRFLKSLKENLLMPEIYHMNPKKSDTNFFRTVTRLLPPQLSWYGAYLFKAFPLDMSQYYHLFNTTRLPQLDKDKIYEDKTAKHIVILRKGHFYTFDVLDVNGNICEPNVIAASLNYILEDSRPISKTPIGILTTSDRNQWASARSHLSKLGNTEVLQKIDSAIFAMILDDVHIGTDYNKLISTYLHGDGINRWFDKSFSLIVTQDGYAGVNFEHSWGDGVAVLRYFNDVKDDISKQPRFHPNDICHLQKVSANVRKLEFLIDDKIESTIAMQKKKYKEWTERLNIDHIIFNAFGKDECKNFGVSPDAVMQLAFQLALYYQKQAIVPTYESCSTAAFKHGRTETIRSCTMETKKTCEALARKNSGLSVAEMKRLIVNCSNIHNLLTKEAAMGQGFDRHLFALKKIWETTNSPKPAIFEDAAYDNINHNILSTSTLSSPAVLAGGFGPVVQDGYGIGYMIQDKRLGAVVTAYKNYCNANEYVTCLDEAFKSIYQVLAHR